LGSGIFSRSHSQTVIPGGGIALQIPQAHAARFVSLDEQGAAAAVVPNSGKFGLVWADLAVGQYDSGGVPRDPFVRESPHPGAVGLDLVGGGAHGRSPLVTSANHRLTHEPIGSADPTEAILGVSGRVGIYFLGLFSYVPAGNPTSQ
jgi:hypothetical protein